MSHVKNYVNEHANNCIWWFSRSVVRRTYMSRSCNREYIIQYLTLRTYWFSTQNSDAVWPRMQQIPFKNLSLTWHLNCLMHSNILHSNFFSCSVLITKWRIQISMQYGNQPGVSPTMRRSYIESYKQKDFTFQVIPCTCMSVL